MNPAIEPVPVEGAELTTTDDQKVKADEDQKKRSDERKKKFLRGLKLANIVFAILWGIILKYLGDSILTKLITAVKYWKSFIEGNPNNCSINFGACVACVLFVAWIGSQIYAFNQDNKEKKKLKDAYQESDKLYKATLDGLMRANTESERLDKERHEELAESNRQIKVLQAESKDLFFSAPNPNVFVQYLIAWDYILSTLKLFEQKNKLQTSIGDQLLEEYEKVFQQIFEKICWLTQIFSKKEEVIYGCNIMCFIPYRAESREYIEQIKNDPDMWFHYTKEKDILGILQIFSELVYTGDKTRKIPVIVLPLFFPKVNEQKLLPGAYEASLAPTGVSLVNSTDVDTSQNYMQLDQEIRNEAKRFFENEGKDIKSFISIRISSSEYDLSEQQGDQRSLSILGIVNIDCNQQNLLGENSKAFAKTYYALIRPIIDLLSPHLAQYLRYYKEKNKIDISI